jgi:hypothetical protein
MAEEQLAEQQNRRRQLLDENGFADDVVSDVAQRSLLPLFFKYFLRKCYQLVFLSGVLLTSCGVLIATVLTQLYCLQCGQRYL